MPQHRGSGRGPHTVEHASHLDAEDAARSVALRRDRLVARQRAGYDPKRAAEIEMLAAVHSMYTGFVVSRQLARSDHAAEVDGQDVPA